MMMMMMSFAEMMKLGIFGMTPLDEMRMMMLWQYFVSSLWQRRKTTFAD